MANWQEMILGLETIENEESKLWRFWRDFLVHVLQISPVVCPSSMEYVNFAQFQTTSN